MYEVGNRILEIREQLGPLLAERGLEVALERQGNQAIVTFPPNEQSSFLSPVRIVFTDPIRSAWDYRRPKDVSSQEATWDHARFLVDDYVERRLGNTGFAHISRAGSHDVGMKKIRGTELTALADLILSNELVPVAGATEIGVESHQFANAYVIVSRFFPDVAVKKEIHENDITIEALLFMDAHGRPVSVSMPVGGKEAVVVVDGEEKARFAQEEISALRRVMMDLPRAKLDDAPAEPRRDRNSMPVRQVGPVELALPAERAPSTTLYDVDDVVRELGESLRPVLEKLRLELAVNRFERKAVVTFSPRDGATFSSPVVIAFEGRVDPGPDAIVSEGLSANSKWMNVYLLTGNYQARRLGDTGYAQWFHSGSTEVKLDQVERSEWTRVVAQQVASYDLVPTPGLTETCIESHQFANAYVVAARRFPRVSVGKEIFADDASVESLYFHDRAGRPVQIRMQVGGDEAVVLVDGEEANRFVQDDVSLLRDILWELATTELKRSYGR